MMICELRSDHYLQLVLAENTSFAISLILLSAMYLGDDTNRPHPHRGQLDHPPTAIEIVLHFVKLHYFEPFPLRQVLQGRPRYVTSLKL